MLKPIKEYPDYYASDDGCVYSMKSGKLKKLKTRMNPCNSVIAGFFKNNKQETKRICRIIAKTFLPDFDEKLQVDHINGDRSDNSVKNLRMVTAAENRRGYAKRQNGVSSKYRGVCWHKIRKKWISTIKYNNKAYHLGYYDTEEEAAHAYNKGVKRFNFQKEALNSL